MAPLAKSLAGLGADLLAAGALALVLGFALQAALPGASASWLYSPPPVPASCLMEDGLGSGADPCPVHEGVLAEHARGAAPWFLAAALAAVIAGAAGAPLPGGSIGRWLAGAGDGSATPPRARGARPRLGQLAADAVLQAGTWIGLAAVVAAPEHGVAHLVHPEWRWLGWEKGFAAAWLALLLAAAAALRSRIAGSRGTRSEPAATPPPGSSAG